MKTYRIASLLIVVSSSSVVRGRHVRASRYVAERQRNVQFANDLMHLKGSSKKDSSSTKSTARGKGDFAPAESKESSGGKGNEIQTNSKSSTPKTSKKGKRETISPAGPLSHKSSSGKKGKKSSKSSGVIEDVTIYPAATSSPEMETTTIPVPSPVASSTLAPSVNFSPAPQADITTSPISTDAPTPGSTIPEPTSTLAPTSEVTVVPSLGLAASPVPSTGNTSPGATSVPISEFVTTLGLDLVPDRFLSSFVNAARIWDTVIVGDMPELIVDSTVLESPNLQCDPSTLPAVIDDIFICASIKPIDGPQGVLGTSGPSLVRFGDTVTVTVGTMNFDEADMDLQFEAGTLEALILHEMAHVYGIGTMWEVNNLAPQTPPCPYSYNSRASEQYRLISGCDAAIPVENDATVGALCMHWDEDCFTSELMTGVSSDSSQLSVLSIATLDDLGYTVDYSRADPFDTSKMNPSCVCKRRQLPGSNSTSDLPLSDFREPSHRMPSLSEEGNRIARAHGMALLEANHQWKNAYLRDDQAELYFGDQIIVVLYMENGFKYTVMVTR